MNGANSVPPLRRPKKSGAFPWLLFGCLGGIAAVIFLVVAAIVVGRMALSGIMDRFTDTEPMPLPQSEMPAEDFVALQERVNAFNADLEAGTATEPLDLTADDINALIQNDPRWDDLKGKVFFTIEDDLITGDISMPIDALAPGRYINGSSSFNVFLRDGMLYVHLDSLTVNGKTVPEEMMAGIRAENLAKDYVRDPEVRESLDRFESIDVSDGVVRVEPKTNP